MNTGFKNRPKGTQSATSRGFSQRVKNSFRGFASNTVDIVGIAHYRDILRQTGISVPNGTAFNAINFKDYYLDYVRIALSNGTIKEVPTRWIPSGYNGNVSATYTVYGTLPIPGFIRNPLKLRPTLLISVVTLETEVQAVLTYASSQGYALPSPINTGDLNTLIAGDKADSTFATRDRYYIMETDGDLNFACLDYKNPGSGTRLNIVGGVTYTTRKGFTGNGTTGYLDTQFNPSTATSYTLNNCGFGVYVYTKPTAGVVLGVVATGARLTLQYGGLPTVFEINGNTSPTCPDHNNKGNYQVHRTSSSFANINKNGATEVVNTADVSVARPNASVALLARNNNGTRDLFCNATVSNCWFGANLGASSVAMDNRWRTYHLSCRVKNTYAKPTPIGVKLNDTFNRLALYADDLTIYEVIGAATWVPDGVKLVVTNGAAGYGMRCNYKYAHSSENCVIDGSFVNPTTPSASTLGMSFGFSDFAGANGERSIFCRLDCSTDVTVGGHLLIHTWNGTTEVQVAISATAFTPAQNDVYVISVTKGMASGVVDYTFTATQNGGAPISVTYSALLGDSTGDFAMVSHQTNLNVTLFKLTLNDLANSDIVFVGDSLSHGAFADGLPKRFTNFLNPSNYQVSAGSGDLTADVVGTTTTLQGKIPNLLDYNARYYGMIIGGNDLGGGVLTPIWQNNLRKLFNAVLNEGHNLILIVPPPRTLVDLLATIGAFYVSDYVNHPIVISVFLSVRQTTGGSGINSLYDFGDAIHLNTLGHLTAGKVGALGMPPLY